jgi:hypothetical protein
VRPALRATAEGGLARHDRTAHCPFSGVVGWVDSGGDQPDQQIVEVFLDAFGQLLALPRAPVVARKAPQFGAHLVRDALASSRVGLDLFQRQAHLQLERMQGAVEAGAFALRVLALGIRVRGTQQIRPAFGFFDIQCIVHAAARYPAHKTKEVPLSERL